MPVIVIGADTPLGRDVVDAVFKPDREVRAFVSDADEGILLKDRGLKVAVGDVSDGSHIEGAATRCFSAVLVVQAATDERERAFTNDLAATMEAWGQALHNAGVRRSIWVGAGPTGRYTKEQVLVEVEGRDGIAVAQEVAELDEAAVLSSGDVQ